MSDFFIYTIKSGLTCTVVGNMHFNNRKRCIICLQMHKYIALNNIPALAAEIPGSKGCLLLMYVGIK